MDLEERRARMETVKCGSVSKAERMDGPRLPPAPIRSTFLIGEDILVCWRRFREGFIQRELTVE